MKPRHEYKHSLNYMDYTLLRSRLRAVLPLDSHARERGEYTVRSLYFDTPTDRALRDKIDGVSHREKFRLRKYGGGQDIKLEKKSKIHGLCYKKSALISHGEARAIIAGDTAWMARDSRELVLELYTNMQTRLLRPKTIVDYIREPFVHTAGNVRVTLDRDIRTGLSSTDFLCDDLPTVSACDEPALLEVKYDEFIPQYLVSLLQLGSRRANSCSKYANCRIYG